MSIEHVYVQAVGGVPDDEAFHKAWHGFRKRRVPCTLVEAMAIESGTLPLNPTTLVAGGIRTVEAAMRQIGWRVPIANNLPDELTDYFGREVRKTTLGAVRSEWANQNPQPCFLKPLTQNKLFGAIALYDVDDLCTVESQSDDTPVIVSNYVLFESEWRVFVIDGEIIGMSYYQGNCFAYPSANTIKSAIAAFHSAPAGYGIDFGVLSDGRTVLIEANDGYSLGSYNLNSVDYARLLEARWMDLAPQARE